MQDPSDGIAEHWLEADDGFRLSVLDYPARGEARAVAVLGHAMMVDRRTVARPDGASLARTLADAGIRVLVPDLRGHGRSGPTAAAGGSWSYDRLVADVPDYVALARRLAPQLRLFLLGNSLFGHVALAQLGLQPELPVAGLVGFSMNIWNRRWTATRWRLALKCALVGVSLPVARLLGRLPAQRLRLGTMDEPWDYWRHMGTTTFGNQWCADDGTDYAAALARVRCPVLHVLSDGDRLFAHADDALLYTAGLGPRREVVRLGPGCAVASLRGLRPGHVEMVASPRCEPLWRYVADWVLRQAGAGEE